ncbi:hypothetical protein Q8791_23320 [Nocardiopsis sp. CT-R113]|uniref:Uncharacterized protein n=1 Tax=Nocardiopsis codii TaxID=3065942 RepID=A0ABU7KD40_9ACTN|nr:hypothetical protein [Nocardiopsis sp. CT-R113]MEE2040151.1 hypothetical protein [Nocardiopsis sp. CT-R113]
MTPTWKITPTDVDGHPAVEFQRPWDKEPTTIRVLDPDRVRTDLHALEAVEADNPGWFAGFLHRHVPVTHLDGLWAQHPGDVLVEADTPEELAAAVTAARTKHGL